MTTPNEQTSEGGRDDRGVPYHAESTLSSAQVRWFLEQALDKVALTAEGGPRRFQGWDSAAVSTSERLRATADRAGRQVNSNVSTTLSVHTTHCITTVGVAGAALPRRARDSFLRFLYSINSLSSFHSFACLCVRFRARRPCLPSPSCQRSRGRHWRWLVCFVCPSLPARDEWCLCARAIEL